MYALQDEPEKGHRLMALAIGAIIAVAVQGGGLYAAHNFDPPEKNLRKPSIVQINIVEPPPPPPPPPEPPPPPPEPPPPPPEPPKPEPPKPKPKPKPEVPPPEPPPPEPPKPEKPVPIVTGLTLGSTVPGGAGPAFQVGNTTMGEVGRTAVDPVTKPATGPVTEQVTPPKPPVRKPAQVKRRIKPAYPVAAKRAGIEGMVVLIVTIDETGRVVDAKVVTGLGYGLDEAALNVVQRWEYEPASVDGEPIKSTRREKIEFILED